MNKQQIAKTAISLIKQSPVEIQFLNNKSFDIYFFSSECRRIHIDKNTIFIFNKEGRSFSFAKTLDLAKNMITEFPEFKLEDVYSQELAKTIKDFEINLL